MTEKDIMKRFDRQDKELAEALMVIRQDIKFTQTLVIVLGDDIFREFAPVLAAFEDLK